MRSLFEILLLSLASGAAFAGAPSQSRNRASSNWPAVGAVVAAWSWPCASAGSSRGRRFSEKGVGSHAADCTVA